MSAGVQFTNYARTTLAAPVPIAATSLVVAAGTGALFPVLGGGQWFYLTLADGTTNGSVSREVVKVTARSGDLLTMTRAQDGTTAKNFSIGDLAELRLNAAALIDAMINITTGVVRLSSPNEAYDLYGSAAASSVAVAGTYAASIPTGKLATAFSARPTLALVGTATYRAYDFDVSVSASDANTAAYGCIGAVNMAGAGTGKAVYGRAAAVVGSGFSGTVVGLVSGATWVNGTANAWGLQIDCGVSIGESTASICGGFSSHIVCNSNQNGSKVNFGAIFNPFPTPASVFTGSVIRWNQYGTETASFLQVLASDGVSYKVDVQADGAAGFGITPHPYCQLHVESTTKGFLPPRLTGTQATAISNPGTTPTGLHIFNVTNNRPEFWNGSAFVSFATGTVSSVSGTAPVVSSGGATPAISMAAATTSVNGYLTSTDWNTFNNKVNSVSGTAPVVSSGGATPAISMAAATGSVNGYLTSTDWTTFNAKAPTASPTLTGIITVDNLVLSGTGTGRRLTADFSNATPSLRAMMQSSITNSTTRICAVPNGSFTTSGFEVYNSSDPDNASVGSIKISTASVAFDSTHTGSGTNQPLVLSIGNVPGVELVPTGGQPRVLIGQGLTDDGTNGVQICGANLAFTSVGKGLRIKEGTNARMGEATLVVGTVVVSNSTITANTRVLLSRRTISGTPGHLTYVKDTTLGAEKFTINSDQATDAGVVTWMLIEPS
jgi:hypothetical protein